MKGEINWEVQLRSAVEQECFVDGLKSNQTQGKPQAQLLTISTDCY